MSSVLKLFTILLFSASGLGQAWGEEKPTCRLRVQVVNGNRDYLQASAEVETREVNQVQCVVVVRRWSKESLNDWLLGGDKNANKRQDDGMASRFAFTKSPPLNFAVVNHGKPFVLDFNESENRLPVIGTLFGSPAITIPPRNGKTSTAFFCSTKNGVHAVECANSDFAVVGRVMAVPNYADEYQPISNGETIEIQYGRVDVSVWLGQKWHPLRFSGPLKQEELNLYFETMTGNSLDVGEIAPETE